MFSAPIAPSKSVAEHGGRCADESFRCANDIKLEGAMLWKKVLIAAVCLTAMAAWTTADAYEFGSPGAAQKPGLVLGNAAATPPPGLYMFDQFLTYQSRIVGPGAPNVGGSATPVHVAVAAAGLVWVPGWNILGATYDAVIAVPIMMADVGSPANITQAGKHNTFIAPIELSWKLGDSGFFVKAGLGMYVPDGTVTGVNGLGNVGNPWWTFQPSLAVSYLKDGWNLTANIFEEINTRNTITGYTSGNVLHAEFTATKTFGRWSIGPVAYYAGQVTDDTSSSFYGGAINVNRYDIWAAGALVSYNFGPATLNVWGLQELSSHASGGTPVAGLDTATITKGFSVFASLSYRLWAPDETPAPSIPRFHK
jgi:hypothetical protein